MPFRQQIRQYRNLKKMPGLVRHYLENYRFTSIAEYYDLDSQSPESAVGVVSPARRAPVGLQRRRLATR